MKGIETMTENEKNIVDDVVEDTDADTKDVINAIDEEKIDDRKAIDVMKEISGKIDGLYDKMDEFGKYLYEGFRDNTNQNYKEERKEDDLEDIIEEMIK